MADEDKQAGKGSAGAVVVCELWRLAIALYLLVVLSGVYKCVNKSNIQSIPLSERAGIA
jgi:hypothetical protein